MKKNLLTVITLALVVVNLVLTAVLAIAIVPEAQKANELITKVATAVDLELQSGQTSAANDYSIDDLVVYNIADSMTINLKNSDDKSHYAILTVAISLYTGCDAYKTYGDTMGEGKYDSLIKTTINDTVQKYTLDELQNNQDVVQKEILEQLQAMFDKEYVVAVGFPSATYQ